MSQCPKEPWKLSWDIGTLGHLGTLIVWPKHRRMRYVLGLNFVILPLNSLNLGSKMFYSMRGIYWYPYIEIQGLKSGQNPCFELMSQCPTGPWILIWDIGTFRDINWVAPQVHPGASPGLALNLSVKPLKLGDEFPDCWMFGGEGCCERVICPWFINHHTWLQ